ncbi:acyltransferase [Halobacteria archaeon HArc-gm2]|nr:acyltransferase [Halobacteria archaeon HArc-gm2]
MTVLDTAMVENSTIGDAEIREYATVHDSEIGDGCQIYERTSIKRSRLAGPVDVNANVYVENATVGERVQIGPNATVAGVTHDLSENGMEFQNDTFEEVVIEDGAFVGAGAVVLPGVRIGENAVIGANATVTEDVPGGTVIHGSPAQSRRSLDD